MLPSGSRLEIAEACEASGVYEGIETVSDASDLGTEKHAYLYEALTTGDAKSALAAVPEQHRDACARIDLSKLPAGQPGRWAGEITFALDVQTGQSRELGRNLKRRYLEAGLRPTEIPATIDVVGLSVDGEASIVTDYKTGWTRATRARSNLQIGIAAVCSTEVYDRPRADGAVLYVKEDEDPWFDVASFEAFDLVSMKERIIEIGRRILRAQQAYADHDPVTGEVKKKPRLVVGRHCHFCPVQMICPAQGALARRFVATPSDTEADLRKGLAENDSAALLYRRLIALKGCVDKMLGIVYARAKRVPIALGDGRVLGEMETHRETLDPKIISQVVRELYGDEWVSKATDLETSKAALKRMARELKAEDGGTMTEHVERILREAGKRGGVVAKRSRSIAEHQVPEGETK
jgi:hypothetical protein